MMHIRLHLVRFMYINLLLSCCFWLYDNVAAADAQTPSNKGVGTGTGTQTTDAAGQTLINPEIPATPPKPEPPPPPLHEGEVVPTPDKGVPTYTSPESESRPKSGDTSVPVEVEQPALSSAHRANSHSEYFSEFDLAADDAASSSTAQVPNNQLNNNNRNSAGKVHSFSESQQLEQPNELGEGREEEPQSPELPQQPKKPAEERRGRPVPEPNAISIPIHSNPAQLQLQQKLQTPAPAITHALSCHNAFCR
ncbi:hypothetical protein M5D96_003352 [Drosophila gunungcola]|uniref:Uncharacterized protein n=1 Tax=Drosophila gunungcola TaxID=103775 RepID=A0A9Q0BRM1_9MUSC|nr:hypothetical protein M5D96_003352 [Drosophila gunungcola]